VTWRAHEVRDLPARGVLLTILAVFALIAAAGLTAYGLLQGIEARTHPPSLAAFPPRSRTGPQLEVAPAGERRAIEARGRARLADYGWVDREDGIARIPIGRAMAILAEQGWPDPEAEP
jgi:hypothetical protein